MSNSKKIRFEMNRIGKIFSGGRYVIGANEGSRISEHTNMPVHGQDPQGIRNQETKESRSKGVEKLAFNTPSGAGRISS